MQVRRVRAAGPHPEAFWPNVLCVSASSAYTRIKPQQDSHRWVYSRTAIPACGDALLARRVRPLRVYECQHARFRRISIEVAQRVPAIDTRRVRVGYHGVRGGHEGVQSFHDMFVRPAGEILCGVLRIVCRDVTAPTCVHSRAASRRVSTATGSNLACSASKVRTN